MSSRFTYNVPLAHRAAAGGGAPQRYRLSVFVERQQPDQSRQPDRVQRRDDVAVLHDPDRRSESAEGGHRDERQFLSAARKNAEHGFVCALVAGFKERPRWRTTAATVRPRGGVRPSRRSPRGACVLCARVRGAIPAERFLAGTFTKPNIQSLRSACGSCSEPGIGRSSESDR